MLRINEMFESIQGEGSWIGRPVMFIRLQGCSLHCDFCDSKITWNEAGKEWDVYVLADKVRPHSWVVLTGGEPTEQPRELRKLISLLHEKGCIVAIESNGTYEWYSDLKADWIVVSPKPKAQYMFYPEGVDELKYVVTKDFNAEVAIHEAIRNRFNGRIWLQPCDYGDAGSAMMNKVLDIVASDSRLRAGIQMHKIYGVR